MIKFIVIFYVLLCVSAERGVAFVACGGSYRYRLAEGVEMQVFFDDCLYCYLSAVYHANDIEVVIYRVVFKLAAVRYGKAYFGVIYLVRRYRRRAAHYERERAFYLNGKILFEVFAVCVERDRAFLCFDIK